MSDVTNKILLIGRAGGESEYSHSVFGEAFFSLPFSVRRLSGTEDRLNITVSERLLGDAPVSEGLGFRISGQIRSYNKRTETSSRLLITVFAREFVPLSEEDAPPDVNEAELTGYICKPPIYRTTPFSREIADMLLAVNRRFGKSDYLPCIAWGRNARYLADLPVGTNLHVIGRLQSREYKKQFADGTEQLRTAYEISCSAVEKIGL